MCNIKAIVGLYRGDDAHFRETLAAYQNEISAASAAAAQARHKLLKIKHFTAENLTLDLPAHSVPAALAAVMLSAAKAAGTEPAGAVRGAVYRK